MTTDAATERDELLEELRRRLHHENCVHDSAGGRFCWSLALIFERRFVTLRANVGEAPRVEVEELREAIQDILDGQATDEEIDTYRLNAEDPINRQLNWHEWMMYALRAVLEPTVDGSEQSPPGTPGSEMPVEVRPVEAAAPPTPRDAAGADAAAEREEPDYASMASNAADMAASWLRSQYPDPGTVGTAQVWATLAVAYAGLAALEAATPADSSGLEGEG